jgi:cobalamin biosynthesis Mg chelatase CobN
MPIVSNALHNWSKFAYPAEAMRYVEETRTMKPRTTVIAMLACCVALFVPSSALAASSPTQDAYSGVAGQQQGGGEPQSTTENGTEAAQTSGEEPAAEASAEESSGTLPFTGFEMAAIAIVAVALLAAGVLLYRRSRHTAPQA